MVSYPRSSKDFWNETKFISESYKDTITCTPEDLKRFQKEEEIFQEIYYYIEGHKGQPFEEGAFLDAIKARFLLEMTISKDCINIAFATDFSKLKDMEIILMCQRDAIGNRILSDKNPEVYDPNYSRGLRISLERWNKIKASGLYTDLNKLEEEVWKNLSHLQSIRSCKSWKEDVVLEISSIVVFIQDLDSDMDYILSGKPLRNLTRHPELHDEVNSESFKK